MFGVGLMNEEALKRWTENMAERDRRVQALKAEGMGAAEAFWRATAEMEMEERDAAQEAKLADIRENGT